MSKPWQSTFTLFAEWFLADADLLQEKNTAE
jgi:hypothetical protein